MTLRSKQNVISSKYCRSIKKKKLLSLAKKTREKTVGMMRSLSAKGGSVYFKEQDF